MKNNMREIIRESFLFNMIDALAIQYLDEYAFHNHPEITSIGEKLDFVLMVGYCDKNDTTENKLFALQRINCVIGSSFFTEYIQNKFLKMLEKDNADQS